MYNSDDATMQTILNSHYITEGQYVHVAIIACILYVQGRNRPY